MGKHYHSAEIEPSLQAQLRHHAIFVHDEVSLRLELEKRATTYTLIKLAPWPARRWKCQYRLMMGADIYDAQTAAEAYARALLAILQLDISSHLPLDETPS
ncbi:MAG TPA: hypothetical protein VL461_03515 [Dictyobacter sp.]|jgi:hypothetical protein|nr:hypothetical protein [Dictyobacter sp.]